MLITMAREKNQSTIHEMNNTPQINWYAVPIRVGGVVEMNSRSQLCLERQGLSQAAPLRQSRTAIEIVP